MCFEFFYSKKITTENKTEYEDKLLTKLLEKLKDLNNCSRRQLYRYLRFFRFYPQIVGTLSPQLLNLMPTDKFNDFLL